MQCTTDNSVTNSALQQGRSTVSSKSQLLRTKEVEKFNSHYSRRPFESLSNINTGGTGRVSEQKKTSKEQMQRSFSFTSKTVLQRSNTTSSANGFHAPLAKRFAFDNSSPKTSSENKASLLRSSSTPSVKTAESTTLMHSSDKMYPACNSSPFQRNVHVSSRDSQLQEFSKCNLGPGDSLESNKRLDPSSRVSTPSNSTANFLSKKELSGLNSPSTCISTGLRPFHNSKAAESDIKMISPVRQQGESLRCTPILNGQTRDSPLPIGKISSSFCNQTESRSSITFHDNLNGTTCKASETPVTSRQSGRTGSNTPQVNQAVMPVISRSHSRTPSVSKTPTSRKFPGPAGLLPKLVCIIIHVCTK